MSEKFEFASTGERRELTAEESERRMVERIEQGITMEKRPTLYTSFGVILNEQERPLVFERKTEPHRGSFSLTGGKIDQSYLQRAFDPLQSALSDRFSKEGLERPSFTMTRELLEELYTHLRVSSDEDVEEFEQRFAPNRCCIIFDANCNAYNMIHRVRALPDVAFSPSSREVGSTRSLDEVDVDQLNPLTRFALKQLGYVESLDAGTSYGPISRMVSPQDILLALKRKKIDPTMELHEPAFLIAY